MERLCKQLVVFPHTMLVVTRKYHRCLDLLEEISEGRVNVRFARHFLASQTVVERGDERTALERREFLHRSLFKHPPRSVRTRNAAAAAAVPQANC